MKVGVYRDSTEVVTLSVTVDPSLIPNTIYWTLIQNPENFWV